MMKTLKSIFVYSILIISSLANPAEPAASEVFKVSSGSVDYYAIGKPSMLKIHGQGKSVEGTMSKKGVEVSGTFLVKMDDFSSGMSLRDSHAKKKIFEAEKYPTASFTLKPISMAPGEKVKINGMLNFHGVEKEVQGEATFLLEKEKVSFDSGFTILLTDFAIQPPEFAGMKINNDVKVEVKVEAKK